MDDNSLQLPLFALEPLPAPQPVPTVHDLIFPSDNEWGIPTLDAAMQVETCPAQLTKWGTVGRNHKLLGCVHFYTHDSKFTALYERNRPLQVVRSGCDAIVETNYSQEVRTPRAVVLHGIFRKRWLARFWQTHKIRVLVDVNVESEFFDIALLGVPRGWRAYANRVHKGSYEHLDAAYELVGQHAGTEPLYIVYGGGEAVRKRCEQNGWYWFREQIWSIHHGSR
jgi:hypothetical protein